MKLSALFLIPVLTVFLFTAPAMAKSEQERNKKTVVDFYELAFNKHQPEKAARKYIGSHYIQHNPNVADGAKPFYTYFTEYFKANPSSHVQIKHVLADGDLVVLHLLSQQNKEDTGHAVVDIFRVYNNKIVEHWDVIQPVPEKSVNKNTMF